MAKWSTTTVGRPLISESLRALGAEVKQFRKIAQRAFPEVSAAVERDGRQRSREQLKSSVVHAVMTGLEDRVLSAMEAAAAEQGWECAALLGDGMMVRPFHGEWPGEWRTTAEAWERSVLEKTGIRVRIAFKTLDGDKADSSVWRQSLHA